MISKHDERIGYQDKWPAVDLQGAAYTRPCATVGLGNGYFAVLPPFITPRERDTLIAELKALIAPVGRSRGKSERGDDETQSE